MLLPRIYQDNLFNDFEDLMDFPSPSSFFGSRPQMPAIMKTDIRETDKAYQLTIDMPGFKKDDVKIQLKDGYMTISAQASSENEEKDESGKLIRQERYSGSASRSFYLGDEVVHEDIHAKFEDGLLKLTIDKHDAPVIKEPTYIAIEG